MVRRSGDRAISQRRDPITRTRNSIVEAETGALGRLDEKLQEFSRFEERISRTEAEAEAARELDSDWDEPRPASSYHFDEPFYADEDDPLFDPQLADLERRFRELERNQQMDRLKKRVDDEDNT